MTRPPLLDALPPAVASLLHERGQVVSLAPGAVLGAAAEGAEPLDAHVPLEGLLSWQLVQPESVVTVAVLGPEGVVGLGDTAWQANRALRAVAVTPVRALRVATHTLPTDVTAPGSPLRALLDAHVADLLAQVAQHVLCGQLHPLPRRAGDWLQLAAERSPGARVPVPALAEMLAVDPAEVPALLSTLADSGVVDVGEDVVVVVDRERLGDAGCGCAARVAAALRDRRRPPGPVAPLSPPEVARLRALAGGTAVSVLARREGMTLADMYRDLRRSYAALGASGRSDAVLHAARLGLLLDVEARPSDADPVPQVLEGTGTAP